MMLFFTGLIVLWWANYEKVPTAEQEKLRSAVCPARPAQLLRNRHPPDRHPGRPGDARLRTARSGAWADDQTDRRGGDAALVGTLARNLKELRKSRDAGSIEGLAASFGLEPNAATIRLYGADANKPLATLEVGTEIEGLKDRRYVRPHDDAGILDQSTSSTAGCSARSETRRRLARQDALQYADLLHI